MKEGRVTMGDKCERERERERDTGRRRWKITLQYGGPMLF